LTHALPTIYSHYHMKEILLYSHNPFHHVIMLFPSTYISQFEYAFICLIRLQTYTKPGFSEGTCIAVSPLHCQFAHSGVCVCVKKKDYEANVFEQPL
jgi:hypothetical protein